MQYDDALRLLPVESADSNEFTFTCPNCLGTATCYRGLDDRAVLSCLGECKEEEIIGDSQGSQECPNGIADKARMAGSIPAPAAKKLDANPWTPMQQTAMEPVFNRVPPQNIHAEQALIGSLMLEPTIVDAIQQKITASDFYRESHREIYKAILQLAASGTLAKTPESRIDLWSLKHELDRKGLFDAVGGKDYILQLEEATPTSLNAEHWADIIRECATKRDVIRASAELMQIAYNGSDLEAITQKISRMMPATVKTESQRPALLNYEQSLKLAEAARDRKHLVTDLLTTEDMSGWAAKKGIGKSTLLRTLAVAVAYGKPFLGLPTNRCKVWYIDLEPGSQQMRHEAFRLLGWGPNDGNLTLTQCAPLAGKPWVFSWLEESIIKHKFEMVIIDTALKLAHVDQANDYGSGLTGLNPLEEIIKKTGVHICAVFHSQKNGNPNNPNASAADLILGSVALAGGLGVCLALRRHKGAIGGNARISLFMDPPRYTDQCIKGEWVLEKDINTGAISLGETLGADWWKTAKNDVMMIARTLPQPFIASAIVDRTPDYKIKEVKKVLIALVEERELEDLGKESRRGGAVQYRVKD